MNFTPQQQVVVDNTKLAILSDSQTNIIISACAGGGKSTVLRGLSTLNADLSPANKTVYLVFNVSQKKEAINKGYPLTDVFTIHGFAHSYIKQQMPINIKYFKFDILKRALKDHLGYKRFNANLFQQFLMANKMLEAFYVSRHIKLDNFMQGEAIQCFDGSAQNNYAFESNFKHAIVLAKDILRLIWTNKLPMTHGFYLKLFHILLANGTIKITDYNLMLVDEAHDLSAVTVEIIKLINVKTTVAVLDMYQNIYGFMNTVNISNEGWHHAVYRLTNSFRCNHNVATKVSQFVNTSFDKDFEFIGAGTDETDPSIAYITRTNTEIINIMLKLKDEGKHFRLQKDYKVLFEPIFAILHAKKENYTDIPYRFDFITKAAKEFHLIMKDKYTKSKPKSFESFIAQKFAEEDEEIAATIAVITKYTYKGILELYNHIRESLDANSNITLTNAHVSKG